MQYKIHIDKQEILDAIDKKMDDIADDVFSKSQSNIVDLGIIDEGTLLKTGNINREYLSKTIIYPMPYAESIEYGRTPGTMPPVSAIQGWVKRKLNVKDEAKSKSIAWAIAMDIKENGTLPRPFLSPAIESVKNKLRG
jgi:hypothetical protein